MTAFILIVEKMLISLITKESVFFTAISVKNPDYILHLLSSTKASGEGGF